MFRKIRDGMTAAVAAVGVTSLIAGAAILGTAGAAQGADQDVPCGTPAQEAVYETIHHPAEPAVYETVVVQEGKEAWTEEIEHPAIPPVYDTVVVGVEYEYVHRTEGHPQSPRWEVDGWNADSNPASDGWTKTGNTREVTEQVLVTEGKDAWTEIVDHPEVPEITEERLVTPAKEAWTEEKLVSPAVPAGPPCVEEPETSVTPTPPVSTPPTPPVSTPPAKDVCTNLPGKQVTVPAGYTETDGVCVEDVIAGEEGEESEPKSKSKPEQPDEVLAAESVPTSVAAGLGGPVAPVGSSAGLLGQGLVAAGLLMLLIAGSAQVGRRRGGHEI
jgi:hypothetical protein